MRTILLNNQKIILKEEFDKSIFEAITLIYSSFHTHQEATAAIIGNHPYTITIILEPLKWEYRNRKEYVKKTRYPIMSKYKELLYKALFQEFGDNQGNSIYGQWLEKYRSVWEKEGKRRDIDDYVVENELEPRYKERILKRYRNHEELFKARFRIDKKRYHQVPEPFSYIDLRNLYDNIFVWKEQGRKVATRGGSGSSGGRESNSVSILGFLESNKTYPIPSYLFLYSQDNTLLFIKKFETLCVPIYDIGSNYDLVSSEEVEKIKQGGTFLKWDMGAREIQTIEVIHD